MIKQKSLTICLKSLFAGAPLDPNPSILLCFRPDSGTFFTLDYSSPDSIAHYATIPNAKILCLIDPTSAAAVLQTNLTKKLSEYLSTNADSIHSGDTIPTLEDIIKAGL